jgi:DNA polymerase I-like protein with 3'-5' exonuclease and polymerase domains
LRIFAAETGDPFMLDAFRRDMDFHDAVLESQYGAKETLNPRDQKQFRFYCKTFNFGWCFGGGVDMLVELMPNKKMAYEFVAKYERTMATAAAWRKKQAYQADRYGFVESRMGTRRRGYLGSLIGSEAINAPIQAGEMEISSKSAIQLNDEGYPIVLLNHDSLVAEVDEDKGEEAAAHVLEVMLNVAREQFPEVVWKADADPPKKRWLKAPSDEEIEEWLVKGAEEPEYADEEV